MPDVYGHRTTPAGSLLAATQAENVESRIRAVEKLGQHGTMPGYWRDPLVLAFSADEVAARELVNVVDLAKAVLEPFTGHHACGACEDNQCGDGRPSFMVDPDDCDCGCHETARRVVLFKEATDG